MTRVYKVCLDRSAKTLTTSVGTNFFEGRVARFVAGEREISLAARFSVRCSNSEQSIWAENELELKTDTRNQGRILHLRKGGSGVLYRGCGKF